MFVEPLRSTTIVQCQLISHVLVFVGDFGCLSAYGNTSIVCDPINHKQQQAALSPLMYLDQHGVTEGNVVYTD